MNIQDENRSPHTEGDDEMTDHFALDSLLSNLWRDHSRNDLIHNSNELDPPSDSNPPNFNRKLECHRSNSSRNQLSTTPTYSSNTTAFSRASSEMFQKIHHPISELSPMDVNQHFTQIMHELCRQFKVDMNFVREMLGNNLTRAEKDLDDAHQPVKLFEIRLQEAESRRDTADQTYRSAQSRSQQARTVHTQHEALKDFGKDTEFRGDISTLAKQLRSKWTEIEAELENATESKELAYVAATEQAMALQELKAAFVPLRVHEEKAREARDACKGTLEMMDHAPAGLTDMMMRAFAGILPGDVFATGRNAAADRSDGATAM